MNQHNPFEDRLRKLKPQPVQLDASSVLESASRLSASLASRPSESTVTPPTHNRYPGWLVTSVGLSGFAAGILLTLGTVAMLSDNRPKQVANDAPPNTAPVIATTKTPEPTIADTNLAGTEKPLTEKTSKSGTLPTKGQSSLQMAEDQWVSLLEQSTLSVRAVHPSPAAKSNQDSNRWAVQFNPVADSPSALPVKKQILTARSMDVVDQWLGGES
ncbi:hypothetical protein FF011L_38250 [Roseimaritima multifibrata]|uniref:Uncharacterized protein n=1 Tax=Roseimaritima multifibrata TaxID=1930274 RepID=A0A517MJG7_9BACT|nr:hypothetical protein [Roseimaritima multifibrata]QDS95041.1 hypothetical protein FF011L_38250 [Roseimaritima multifibrata]